eukprot:gene6576-7876_t
MEPLEKDTDMQACASVASAEFLQRTPNRRNWAFPLFALQLQQKHLNFGTFRPRTTCTSDTRAEGAGRAGVVNTVDTKFDQHRRQRAFLDVYARYAELLRDDLTESPEVHAEALSSRRALRRTAG